MASSIPVQKAPISSPRKLSSSDEVELAGASGVVGDCRTSRRTSSRRPCAKSGEAVRKQASTAARARVGMAISGREEDRRGDSGGGRAWQEQSRSDVDVPEDDFAAFGPGGGEGAVGGEGDAREL